MSDRAARDSMIVLDTAPTMLRVRGEPMFFRSAEEALEHARLHDIPTRDATHNAQGHNQPIQRAEDELANATQTVDAVALGNDVRPPWGGRPAWPGLRGCWKESGRTLF